LESLFLRVETYDIALGADGGRALATVTRRGDVQFFEYTPSDAKTFLVPLWGVFPFYTSVTSGWRQGYGEVYRCRWHAWYRSLTDEERDRYRRRFPAPTDHERCWTGFFEDIAAVPGTGKNPLAEFIIGRI
jgi:hypothetical protein